MPPQAIVTGLPKILRVGPEFGGKPFLLPVAPASLLSGREDPRDHADLFHLREKKGPPPLLQGGGDDLPGSLVKRADESLMLEKERIHPRSKSDQGFLPIDALIQLDSSIELALLDEVLDELLQNLIGILQKDHLVYSCHWSSYASPSSAASMEGKPPFS